MHSSIFTLATAAQLLGISAAAAVEHQHQQFYRWNIPSSELGVYRRQGPLPGYHPEFGTCGSGTTCENACGSNWELCKASTSLSLFCYNKVELGQTCCENGSGRACDRGYYCAWNEFGGKTWCCKDGQSLEECGVTPLSSSSTTSTTSTTTTTTSTTTSCPSVSVVTVTDTKTVTISQSGGGTVTSTVTVTIDEPISTITVSVYSTISVTVTSPGETITVPGGTVTVPGGTVTIPGGTVTIPGGTVTIPGGTVTIPGGTVTVPGGTVTIPGETVTVTTPGGCISSSTLPPPPTLCSSKTTTPPPPPPPPTPCSSTSPPPPPPPPPPPHTSTPCETKTWPPHPTKPTHPYVHYTTKRTTVTTEVPCSTTERPHYQVEVTPLASGDIPDVVTTTSSIVTAGARINSWNQLGVCLALAVAGIVVL